MTRTIAQLDGLVPDRLAPKTRKIVLDEYQLDVDIGFHEFEIGRPQRLIVSVEIWLQDRNAPRDDDPIHAWNYDFLRTEVAEIASAKRYNLQETLAHAIFERVAAFKGIAALRIRLSKPDVYPDAHGVGVEIASFSGAWPEL